ncbi:flagellar export protein FliJ [Paucibacter sp. APW11]|uniref:Flagellar FliJ protein n=1 Tax=Roseateles aquae TaxID=3077235 RepID=A0ABU3PAP5_9BURK|nr:flagellar export protein FliJ [Paucibacter sp. APW11]MDT8999352.1 flagellar export protein FliJ [Paucibacter sp. APW11]
MSTTHALTLLLERAESERDEALRALQDAQQQANAARDQQGQLAQYRSEYQQRWTATFARATTVDILGCYQNFSGRLNQAIDQQGLISVHADRRVDMAREVLRERELRVASVRKLLERRRLDQLRLASRQEQKASDEQAARTAYASQHGFMRLSA